MASPTSSAIGFSAVPPPHEGLQFSALVKYLYFVRFSLLLWAFFPLFVVLDWSEKLAAMTKGIVAMDSGWHLVLASFFVVAAGWVALLSARIVCAYGEERFGCPPPWYFAVGEKMSWWAFLGAQIPGFFLLGYVGHATRFEQGVERVMDHGVEIIKPPALGSLSISGFIVLGILLALACWTLMAGIYYWMFWRTDVATNPARAFVVPYAGIFKKIENDPPSTALVGLLTLFDYAAGLGPGYSDPGRGAFELHSGHAFAFLNLGFLAAIYLSFWDFTAPVELPKVRSLVQIIFLLAALVWIILSVRSLPDRRRMGDLRVGRNLVRMLVLFLPMLVVAGLPFFVDNHPLAMPVLGFVTVLVTFITWGLAGFAFGLDRYRIPVLSLVLIGLGLWGYAFGKAGDHYITSYPFCAALSDKKEARAAQPPSLLPRDVLCRFEGVATCDRGILPRPLVVVTATGGGIHAAAWTSTALSAIEDKFEHAPELKGAKFHDSILMMSTVSGGSVGVTPWLGHYLDGSTGFTDHADFDITACSDLQAAAWGLTYADFLRLFLPAGFSRYDRGWALEQAFGRNRQLKCELKKFKGNDFDLSQEKNVSAFDPQNHPGLPAFSLNTTAEETGARFLIANYKLPEQEANSEIASAHSFLDYFGEDIPLSTAARLSANFPYISPMPRLQPLANLGEKDERQRRRNYHFGDGGYFDNDGTASAMEFLWYALSSRVISEPKAPVPVLIIEIRDGDDPSGLDHDDPTNKDWPGQAAGPVTTFYNANHVSVTRRNRRELCFMEKGLEGKASFTHIVLPFDPCPNKDHRQCSPGTQPLSWHLTHRQILQMRTARDNVSDEIKGIATWYAKPQAGPESATGCDKWEASKKQ